MPIFYIALKDSNYKKSVYFSPLLQKVSSGNQTLCLTNQVQQTLLPAMDSLAGQTNGKNKRTDSRLWEAVQKTNMQLFNDAIKDYDKLIAEDPLSAIAWFARGVNTCKEVDLIIRFDTKAANEKYEKALLDFSKAIQLEPAFAFAYYNRAIVKCQLHDYTGAEKDCALALKADKHLADAYYNRGLLLLFLKDKMNACQNFSVASELGILESYSIIKKYCNHF
jgi:tetratricopeptide (TPR) repeat protein